MKKHLRREKEVHEEFIFDEKAEFTEMITEEEFRMIVQKVYYERKLLSSLKASGSNVCGTFYSKSNRKLYDFMISFNHKGMIDGKYLIKFMSLEDTADDWYVIDVATRISQLIKKYLRDEPFICRRIICRVEY